MREIPWVLAAPISRSIWARYARRWSVSEIILDPNDVKVARSLSSSLPISSLYLILILVDSIPGSPNEASDPSAEQVRLNPSMGYEEVD